MPYLKTLQIQNLRNLGSVDIAPCRRFNVFFGDNAAGKTSLLEAIHVLSSNRSFRTNKFSYMIRSESADMLLFCLLADEDSIEHRLGIQRSRTMPSSKVRLDGAQVNSSSTLAQILPLITLDSSSFELLDGSPGSRRRFLDWIVFHVKPDYLNAWKSYQRALKQRNILLRRGKLAAREELDYWSLELCKAASHIEPMRRESKILLENALFEELSSSEDLEIQETQLDYISGWPSTMRSGSGSSAPNATAGEEVSSLDKLDDYLCYLSENLERDYKQGFTQLGSHKNDIKIKVAGRPANEVLSRGQKKTLVLAFHLAKARLFTKLMRRLPVFLLDDLPSELDSKRLAALCEKLGQSGSQIFITSVSKTPVLSALSEVDSDDCDWFHVKHGSINADL